MSVPLVETKIHLPRPRDGLIARPRLWTLLEQGERSRLTPVSAPAAAAFISGGGSALGDSLEPTAGLLVVVAYAVVPMIVGAVVLRTRDT